MFVSAAHGFENKRYEMVARQLAGRDVSDKATLDAMRSVPRDLFVPDSQQAYAYHDRPLPIGCGQTISQPYIVGVYDTGHRSEKRTAGAVRLSVWYWQPSLP